MQQAASNSHAADAIGNLPGLIGESWDWDHVLVEPRLSELEQALAAGLLERRWFGSKTQTIARLQIVDSLSVTRGGRLVLVAVAYEDGPAEIYQLALAFAGSDEAEQLAASRASFLWARTELEGGQTTGVLFDPTCDADFCQALLHLIAAEAEVPAAQGTLRGSQYGSLHAFSEHDLTPRPAAVEQSNTSILYGEQLILKLFRKIDRGRNPDFEISAKLTEHGFAHGAPVAGVLEYQTADAEPWTLGLLQRFVPNQGDAWQYTLGRLASLLARADAFALPELQQWITHESLFAAANQPIPPGPREALNEALRDAELLGRRTAEMHHTLAAVQEDTAFAPQPFSADDASTFHDRALEMLGRSFATLRKKLPSLTEALRQRAESVLARQEIAAAQFDQVRHASSVAKIRCHGDYHLGQVLVSQGDFVIIDFEGEPARPLDQRRQKQLALRDVAGMLRSFHYAACTAATAANPADPQSAIRIGALSRAWLFWASVAFVSGYRHAAGTAEFVPASDEEFERLLEACRLDKAVYELLYELNNRPDWVYLPLEALDEMLNPAPDTL